MATNATKKLINDPSNTVNEALEGFVMVNPNVALIQEHKVVIRKDVKMLQEADKVCLISGGGSGHEPAHVGYIGEGMLTAVVCGDVFASPPSSAVLAAIRACNSTAGVLLIVKNYTGDRLHFGKAAERAKAEGIRVEMVVVGEDCALASDNKSAGRRGLCGIVFIHKIAGAMAESGKSLDDIVNVVSEVAKNMGTISISLSPCSLPGQSQNFEISPDGIEFGLGIHGEPGVKKMKLTPAKAIVKEMVDYLLGSEYMPKLDGKNVAVILNNLGGTSNLEMSLVAGEVLKYLRSIGLFVERFYVGAFMTSLEMAGVSITVLASSKSTVAWLDEKCSTAWCHSGHLPEPHECFVATPLDDILLKEGSEVQSSTGKMLFTCLQNVCTRLLENEQYLNELDRAAGDGDCGTTLARGSTVIMEHLGTVQSSLLPLDDPSKLTLSLATLLENSMGGSSGAIFSLFLTALAKGLKGHSQTALTQALFHGIEAVKEYGGAVEGDRTLLDALCPAIKAFGAQETAVQAAKSAAAAAMKGAQNTIPMAANAGRSSYVCSTNLTVPDPGAMAVALVFAAIAETVSM